jgi:hypothetical protein
LSSRRYSWTCRPFRDPERCGIVAVVPARAVPAAVDGVATVVVRHDLMVVSGAQESSFALPRPREGPTGPARAGNSTSEPTGLARAGNQHERSRSRGLSGALSSHRKSQPRGSRSTACPHERPALRRVILRRWF